MKRVFCNILMVRHFSRINFERGSWTVPFQPHPYHFTLSSTHTFLHGLLCTMIDDYLRMHLLLVAQDYSLTYFYPAFQCRYVRVDKLPYLMQMVNWMYWCLLQGDIGEGNLFAVLVSLNQEQRGWLHKIAGNQDFGKSSDKQVT